MMENFTKADLKDGMVVETREGNRYFKIGSRCVAEDGWLNLALYEEDLTEISGSLNKLDILAVYTINDDCCYSVSSIEECMNSDVYTTLIWQRNETECLTAYEMAAELSKLTSKKYEVKPSHGDMFLDISTYCTNTDCCICSVQEYCGRCSFYNDLQDCEEAYNILKKNGEL